MTDTPDILERLRSAPCGGSPAVMRQINAQHSDAASAIESRDAEIKRLTAWRPMETAPRDGTEVLLCLRRPFSGIEKARWFEPWGVWLTEDPPDDPDKGEICGIGANVPLAWQPLPDPPRGGEKG